MTDPCEALLSAASSWIVSLLTCTLAPDDHAAGADATAHRERFDEIAAGDERMEVLRRLKLSETELAIVLTLAVVELDPAAHGLLRALDPQSALGALRRFIYGAGVSSSAFSELGPAGRLERLGVIEPVASSGPDGRAGLRVSRRILGLLLGADPLPVPPLAIRPTPDLAAVAAAATTVEALRRAVIAADAIVVVSGLPGLGRRTVLAAVAAEAGTPVLDIDARRLAKDEPRLLLQLRSIALECALSRRVPLIANLDALVDEKGERLALVGSELAPLIEGPILVTCGLVRPRLDWERPTILVEMGPPTSAQRTQLWHTALGQGTLEDAQLLTDHYPLAPALVVRAAEAAKAHAGARALQPENIFAGIRAVLDDKLGHYARRVTVTQTWEDLVLPQDQVDAIIERAAFLAANEGAAITAAHLERAARVEYEGMGKIAS